MGHLSDKYGSKKILLYVVSSTIVLFYVLVFSRDLTLAGCLILLAALGALFGVINPLTIAWGHSLVPEAPSTVSGLLMGFAWCIGNLGPAFAGMMHSSFSQNSDQLILTVMGMLLICVFFLLLAAPATQQKPVLEG
jgi:MFS family permease